MRVRRRRAGPRARWGLKRSNNGGPGGGRAMTVIAEQWLARQPNERDRRGRDTCRVRGYGHNGQTGPPACARVLYAGFGIRCRSRSQDLFCSLVRSHGPWWSPLLRLRIAEFPCFLSDGKRPADDAVNLSVSCLWCVRRSTPYELAVHSDGKGTIGMITVCCC